MTTSAYFKYLPLLLLPFSLSAQTTTTCDWEPCELDCVDLCCGEFYVSGSFLYWNAGSNSLYYVVNSQSDISDTIPPKDVINSGELREPGFSWNAGVQGSIGWRECECGWDFVLRGTYYTTTSKDSISKPLPQFGGDRLDFLTPSLNPSFSGNFLGSAAGDGTASAQWDLTFGMIDALGGGSFTPWHCLSLKPHFGLRTAWIHQDLSVHYSPISFFTADLTVLSGDQSHTDFTNHFWGIGFKGGIDFEAFLCSNFRLIGGLGASLLYGKIHSQEHFQGHTVDPGMPTLLNNLSGGFDRKINKLAADLETEMGLAYRFEWDCFGLDLSARYLFSIWFDQCEIQNFLFTVASVSTPPLFLNFQQVQKIYSNLIIQGVNVQLTFSF